MSKVCIILMNKSFGKGIDVKDLNRIFRDCCFSFSDKLTYIEPFLEEYRGMNYTLVNLSDHSLTENCEMFLLPDNCYFNDRTNQISFRERMLQLQKVLEFFLDRVNTLDLFIGDSGTKYDEFDDCIIGVKEFAHISELLNSPNQVDMHITIRKTGDGSPSDV